jgi:hypothetical protein
MKILINTYSWLVHVIDNKIVTLITCRGNILRNVQYGINIIHYQALYNINGMHN